MSCNSNRGSSKILVLGDSGVGKSSLIHLICHSSVLSSAQWTIGCSIDVKLEDNYFLEFWDVGGSRSHKIARSFLYQDYHGIILVFDATNNKSRLNLNEWLMEVTQKSNEKDLEILVNINIPLITIATKKDLLPHGTVLETNESSELLNGEHSSVVNFNENSETNFPIRRHLSSFSSPLSAASITPFLHSQPTTNFSSNFYDLLLSNQVIHVNTQDVLSFQLGSKNNEKLNDFFKHVTQMNMKMQNKFSI